MKEAPFLLLMILGALNQVRAPAQIAAARAHGLRAGAGLVQGRAAAGLSADPPADLCGARVLAVGGGRGHRARAGQPADAGGAGRALVLRPRHRALLSRRRCGHAAAGRGAGEHRRVVAGRAHGAAAVRAAGSERGARGGATAPAAGVGRRRRCRARCAGRAVDARHAAVVGRPAVALSGCVSAGADPGDLGAAVGPARRSGMDDACSWAWRARCSRWCSRWPAWRTNPVRRGRRIAPRLRVQGVCGVGQRLAAVPAAAGAAGRLPVRPAGAVDPARPRRDRVRRGLGAPGVRAAVPLPVAGRAVARVRRRAMRGRRRAWALRPGACSGGSSCPSC